eukprot:10368472-Lingulodinium_polyedra.AAC.1
MQTGARSRCGAATNPRRQRVAMSRRTPRRQTTVALSAPSRRLRRATLEGPWRPWAGPSRCAERPAS